MKNLIRVGIVGLVLLASLLPCLTISPVSATGNISYGVFGGPTVTDVETFNLSEMNWFIASKFDWILLLDYYSSPISANSSGLLASGGKEVILRVYWWDDAGNFSAKTWTDIYNSMIVNGGDGILYGKMISDIEHEINTQGLANISSIDLSDEEPIRGWGGNASLVNVSQFSVVNNQMYIDLKATYPTLKIFPDIHISYFTNGQLTALSKDGIFDDQYTANMTTLSAWFTRMVTYGGADTYCRVHASGSLDASFYDVITPVVVRDTNKLASSLNVPHLQWFSWVNSGGKWILFNNWSACNNSNDPTCAENYKDTILGIVNHTQNILDYNYKVNASTDDAGQVDGGTFSAVGPASMFGKQWGDLSKGGVRFLNVTAPANGSFRFADLKFYSNNADTINISTDIYSENSSSPATFSTVGDFNNRSKSTAFLVWNCSSFSFHGALVPSINVTTIVQELLGRYSYSSGHNMSLLIYGVDTGKTAGYNVLQSATWDSDPAYGAELHLEYDMPIYVGNYTASAHGVIIGTSPQNIYYGENSTTVIAAPNYCCHFVNWSDAYPTATRTDLNVLANVSVTANFALDVFTLTYTNGSNGGILGNLSQTVNCGSNGSAVTAVANSGYHFVNWNDSSIANPRTDTSVLINTSVTANFALNAPPASIGGTMGTIIVIVLSFLIVIMLLGYSINEYSKNGFNENTKVAIAGIITIIIAETILIAFF